MENWGNFFDQAPQMEAQLPVAAMRAAVRGGPKVFPTQSMPIGPSTLVQAPQARPMELMPPPELKMDTTARNDISDLAKNVGDAINPPEEKEKGDGGFGERMKLSQIRDRKL